MARNGSGVYSLYTPGNPVVPDTDIESDWANNTLNDIASAITQSLSKDGQTTATGNLPMGNNKLTGLGAGTSNGDSLRFQQLFSQGNPIDIASASTTDIGGQLTNFLNVTGTTTITSFGTNYNGPKILKFTGVLIITHNSSTLVCPNGLNITTAAGDYAIVVPKSTSSGTSDGWAVAFYQQNAIEQYVPIRQTVMAGPVDSSGFSSFGGSTGSTTVTASGTLKITGAVGLYNRIGSIVNPSWTGLSTNGTMYLYCDISSNGTVSTGSSTLAPVYQWGGTYSVTNGQATYNIQEATMKVGDGSAANDVCRVFVGEVTVSGGVVTAITWYQLNGRYNSGTGTTPTNAATTFTHNIGLKPLYTRFTLVNNTTELSFAVGDEETPFTHRGGGQYMPVPLKMVGNNSVVVTPATVNSTPYNVINTSTGDVAAITLASWRMRVVAERGW